ncbi:50S ribosomal protein L32 [Candidatus Kaiserbacteria bacterium CG10_big_fil_rev_8_21_14_0_10_49_17]|uniref:Large ribosomal subunit protein bL32 n=1 Tax=Candidatus Kaiserbacteria bacterium CG10_big_fil_rev_8_21_14_0_10_49_17 TaxID=1974609 RepID=A0A2M6WEX5_9BACT|nr:MAG: 50S ribosomal protein L32 [Candidatus Kaiserbacteria bacterium CG10_big_fil_rev_8_21_14_0_10_49_17]
MSSRMRVTRSHRNNRRSHHALVDARLSVCGNCNATHLRHRVCGNCGQYRGRIVVDVAAAAEKKAAKAEARKEALREAGIEDSKTPAPEEEVKASQEK